MRADTPLSSAPAASESHISARKARAPRFARSRASLYSAGGLVHHVAETEVRGRLGSFRRALRQEASDRWGVGPALAEALFLLPFGGAVAIVLARDHKPLFRFLTSEDSVFEWPQFVGFAAASILAFACAWKLRKAGRPLLALAYFAFGLGCFFVAGEEIAWGQRILGFGTPEPLEEINEQEEVTVHNSTRCSS